jgi:nucleotide-binding universal stress UspA family protein
MFRRIVVGYDGSERGGEAIALAEALRDLRGGTLLLTSAYLPAPVATAPLVTVPDLREPTEASLAEAPRSTRWSPPPTTRCCCPSAAAPATRCRG